MDHQDKLEKIIKGAQSPEELDGVRNIFQDYLFCNPQNPVGFGGELEIYFRSYRGFDADKLFDDFLKLGVSCLKPY